MCWFRTGKLPAADCCCTGMIIAAQTASGQALPGVRSSCPKGILVWGATRAGPLPCKTATPSAGFSHSADSRPCCSWCWLQCRQQTTLQLVLIAQHLQMLTAADTCSLHSCAEDSWLQRCCFGWRQWQPPHPVLLCCADICPADVYARQCFQHSAS